MFEGSLVFFIVLGLFAIILLGMIMISIGRDRKESMLEGCGWALILSLISWGIVYAAIVLLFRLLDFITGR